MPSNPDPDREPASSDWDEGPPRRNAKPPTPFELASLAVPFLVAGKKEGEAFRLARRAFERAEEEVMDFVPYEERTMQQAIAAMPHFQEEWRKECEAFQQALRVKVPDEAEFPMEARDFYDRVLPQRLLKDRKRFFENKIWPMVSKHFRGRPVPAPDTVPDLCVWYDLFTAVSRVRRWNVPSKLKADVDSLHSPKRRGSKDYRPRRTSAKKVGKSR